MEMLCALQIKMRQQDGKMKSTATKAAWLSFTIQIGGYCWAVEQLVTIDESASSVQMNKGERLVGASEKFYMQGSIDSVAVKPILCHEHESNVAWSLFATDDWLKDCVSFRCLFDNEMIYLFAKTGEVYEVYEFGWNDKTKVCFSWKYDCVGKFPASTLQFECKRANSISKYQFLHLAAQIGNDSFVRPMPGENVSSFELITYKWWCPSSEAVLASELNWNWSNESTRHALSGKVQWSTSRRRCLLCVQAFEIIAWPTCVPTLKFKSGLWWAPFDPCNKDIECGATNRGRVNCDYHYCVASDE